MKQRYIGVEVALLNFITQYEYILDSCETGMLGTLLTLLGF